MHCCKGSLRFFILISLAILMAGCTVHRFPVVRPMKEIPREINSQAKAQEYFIRARDYERRGLDQSAEKYFEMAYELDPSSKVLQEQIVRKYLEAGKFTQALVLIKKDRKNSELDRESKRTVSAIYLKMGEFNKAADVLESIPEKSEEEVYSLGLIYESLGKIPKALSYYLDFFNRKPESIQMGNKIGKLLINEKKFEEAESLFIAMKTREGENPEILTMLGSVRVLQGDTATALQYFTSALTLDSLNEDALRSIAQLYLSRNDYVDAITCYEKLYNNSSFAELYGRTLALLYYYNKQFDKAEVLLTGLLQESIDDYELHYYLGLVFAASERNDLARLEIEKALTITNTFEAAWKDLCYISIKEKDYEQANQVAQRYTDVLPQSASSWRLKGYVATLNKDYGQAVKDLSHSLKIDSTDIYTWFELGSAFERNKQFDRGVGVFKKVLELRPDDAAASNYLGYMWAEKGVKLDSATVLLESALKQEPENGAFLDSYAWILFQKGQVDSAYKYLQKAIVKINDDPVIFNHLGDILAKKNDFTGAIKAFRECLELNSEDSEQIRKKITEIQIYLKRNEN